MTDAQIEIQLIAIVTAVACAIPGTFLVLRKMAMISDAISHAILPGIVVAFFLTEDINHPLLILFASLTGVLTAVLVEYIQNTKLVKEDTAIGLVFPALFSIGVILIAKQANDIHLDIDAVLLGELALAPFNRFSIMGLNLGPKALWTMGVILVLSLVLLVLFFKELKLSTFDKGLATSLGFSPVWVHYGIMGVSSVTTVGAFDVVGSVLVISLMIAPPATAYLLTQSLKKMLLYAVCIGAISSVLGYWIAHYLDASIAGSIASLLGLVFLMAFLFSSQQGIIRQFFREKSQKLEISLLTFLLHLQNHEENEERHINHLTEHINWGNAKAKKIMDMAMKYKLIYMENHIIFLTPKGIDTTQKAIELITNNKNIAINTSQKNFLLSYLE